MLISTFITSQERNKEVMENLKTHLENNTAMVAGHVIDNRLKSFVWCHERTFGGTKRLHVTYFVVDKNYRGKGLSHDLLSFVKKQAERNNIIKIDLNVNPENELAIKVYEKIGFKAEKIQLVYDIEKGNKNV